jgi:hypothetical protein
MPYSQQVLAALDLPQDHSGPYDVIDLSSRLLVKVTMSYPTFEAALPDFALYYSRFPNHRLIQESDRRWYLNNANTLYRSSWEGDEFVGPENWRDISQVERLHPVVDHG